MPRPNYSRVADRERLALLVRRRATVPADMCRFPAPPPYLSPVELAAWDAFRSGFRATGVIDAGHFAYIEVLVSAYATGNRLRELRARTHGEAARSALGGEIIRQDGMLRAVLDKLGCTKAMLTRLAMHVPGLVDRVGLPVADRRRVLHA